MSALMQRHEQAALAPNGGAARKDDPQLAEALARLRDCPSVLAPLTAEDWEAIKGCEGPEISGSMRSRRRRAA